MHQQAGTWGTLSHPQDFAFANILTFCVNHGARLVEACRWGGTHVHIHTALSDLTHWPLSCCLLYLAPPQALRLHQEHHLSHTLDLMCRIPCMRHAPLKELTRLAGHLKETTYSKGRWVALLLRGRRISQPNLILIVSGSGLSQFDEPSAPPVCMRLLSCCILPFSMPSKKVPAVTFYLQVSAFCGRAKRCPTSILSSRALSTSCTALQ